MIEEETKNQPLLKEKPKLKNIRIGDWITIETRISLFQTCMNNSGRNFEGKRVKVKRMADFAIELYKLGIKEIENIGELNVLQIAKTFKKDPIKKVEKKSAMEKLMKKIKGKKGKK
jgi:hypothetical protein